MEQVGAIMARVAVMVEIPMAQTAGTTQLLINLPPGRATLLIIPLSKGLGQVLRKAQNRDPGIVILPGPEVVDTENSHEI